MIGVNQGSQLRKLGLGSILSSEAMARGSRDGLSGKDTTPADGQRLQAYVRTVLDANAARNKTAAQEFLARNAKEKGVKTTPSGLQYKVIAAGNAAAESPKPEDQVTVQYRGKLLDGSEFDSTYTHGSPATFPDGGVIKGWQEALVLMKPGAKWQLFIPPDLAYGQGQRPGIPGGSLLVFDVELLSVKSKPQPPASANPPMGPNPATIHAAPTDTTSQPTH